MSHRLRLILDLGSGIGTVGMIAAWRLPRCTVSLPWKPKRRAFVSRVNRPLGMGLEDRYDIRCGDLRDPSVLREDERFDLILGSPPYFPLGTGVESTHPQKAGLSL